MFEIFLFAAFFIFYCHLASEWEQRHTTPAPVDDLPQLPELMEQAAAATIAQPTAIAVIPTAPDYASMNSTQLRKECSRRGIKCRNFHGRNKHMSKGEMLKALAT